ncbi:MAG: dihydroorotate dehydrogenase [Clostridia bacterium]|nr:dihydroorotate dehydrogenase [Clostridia bacterium]
MVDMKISLCGVQLDNPVIPASGTFGYGREFAELYDINMLGTFSFKGTTGKRRFGNPTPRIAECREGLINSVGLQNPGVDSVIGEELPALAKVFSKPVMANVSGFSIEEYVSVALKLAAQKQVGWIELNISCPNVHNGGMVFGTDPKQAAEVVGAVRKALDSQKASGGSRPLIVKLSPNVTDLAEIAFACEDAGADGLTLINTLQGMRIDLKTGRPVIANRIGGFSGPAVMPVALRMVYQVYERVRIPIIGCGGVSSAEDVLEMMLAGATAVQVGSANLVNPYACRDIIEALPETMKKYGIETLSDITGGAH